MLGAGKRRQTSGEEICVVRVFCVTCGIVVARMRLVVGERLLLDGRLRRCPMIVRKKEEVSL